ncbi:hypothetical protein D023_4572 [Vibrio parahaemolyticus 3256]|nr:hypothetical protein Vp2S01_0298 [Vibrio parahaemolyticus]EQL83182.1 hypothetical protein D052_4358 [Vibrio parahaemolyticus 10290]EQM12998.1 hypothetical protein D024_0154 [Vibrio parahaemolyticus 3259]ESV66187.1 hypothetical protein D021_4685 [Vibrio parahaemolyticus 10296]ETJ86303.1 hypothetical protein D029_4302 [Vibrio parahaemolyticus 970107]ETT16127.1 hypothetical protein D023_4572 [Vibrio parahaemolyticus 3256]EVT80412.1 hypothetical protein D018_4803 [Vibrio parahaemolyticus VP200
MLRTVKITCGNDMSSIQMVNKLVNKLLTLSAALLLALEFFNV